MQNRVNHVLLLLLLPFHRCGRELLYLGAIFFQGGAGGGITGFVNNARQWLWIPVSQDAYRWTCPIVFACLLFCLRCLLLVGLLRCMRHVQYSTGCR